MANLLLASRGVATYVRLPLLHHHSNNKLLPNLSVSVVRSRKQSTALYARYSQAQDFSSRFQVRASSGPTRPALADPFDSRLRPYYRPSTATATATATSLVVLGLCTIGHHPSTGRGPATAPAAIMEEVGNTVCKKKNSNSIDDLPKLVEDIFQTSLNTGPRGAVRLAQGIQAIIGVGGEWLTDLSKSANASSGLPMQMQLGLLSPQYLRKLFERMGATYIKLGQFIASAPTLFPPEYVQEFQRCFDSAPAVPYDEIQAILRQELGGRVDSVYEYVNPVPLASASIAQVHGARLRGSKEDVVIKVLKPGIEDILVADLNFVYVVARILEFLNPELSRASLVSIVKDIKASMLEEVDFIKEAANIDSFRLYLESMGLVGQATAPKVYPHCSTKRVLTMERLYGVPLTDLDSISSLVSSPETSLITALNVWFGSLLGCESFHADVHAGNLWLLRDGRIGFLDFGIVGRISPKTWAAMEIFLASLSSEDYEAMASSLVTMGATDSDVDAKAFASDLKKVFSSIQNLDTEVIVAASRNSNTNTTKVAANVVVDERQMNALFLDVVLVSESYGLRFPREFALLMKQLLYFDRYTRLLAPNMNMLQDQRISITSNRRMNNRVDYQ